jgi:hypothetical protein
MNSENTLIPHLKKDALVPVTFGTGFVQQLGIVLSTILENKSDEDLKKLEKLVKEDQPLDNWMISIAVMQTLIKTIYAEAEKLKMVEFKSVESSLQESLSSDQSLEQPE